MRGGGSARLSSSLQIQIFERRFKRLNPDADVQAVDFKGVVGEREKFEENLEELKRAYPFFAWQGDIDPLTGQRIAEDDPYEAQLLMDVRQRAAEHGLELVEGGALSSMKRAIEERGRENRELREKLERVSSSAPDLPKPPLQPRSDEPLDRILKDVWSVPIIFVAARGHGKTTLLKNVLDEFRRRNPQVKVKVFDVSQAHYHGTPVAYHLRVERRHLFNPPETDDCVFEMGMLSKEERRRFAAAIVGRDYKERYAQRFGEGPSLPPVLYIFEEANTYFDSWSLSRRDEAANILTDFISVGRNYNLLSFLVATVVQDELATKIRRRAAFITGKLAGEGEIRAFKTIANTRFVEVAKTLEPYRFMYWWDKGSEPFSMPPRIFAAPRDLPPSPQPIEPPPPPPVEAVERSRDDTLGRDAFSLLLYLILIVIFIIVLGGGMKT